MKRLYHNGTHQGNCFSVCLACMLEINPAKVPVFKGKDFWEDIQQFLEPWDLWLVQHHLPQGGKDSGLTIPDDTLVIVGGTSNLDGHHHALIGRFAESRLIVEHDPDPNSQGISDVLTAAFLVPRRPHLLTFMKKELSTIVDK